MVDTVLQEPQDPFSLVSDELSLIADRLRAMVVAKVYVFSISLASYQVVDITIRM